MLSFGSLSCPARFPSCSFLSFAGSWNSPCAEEFKFVERHVDAAPAKFHCFILKQQLLLNTGMARQLDFPSSAYNAMPWSSLRVVAKGSCDLSCTALDFGRASNRSVR